MSDLGPSMSHIPMPIRCEVDGRTWRLYDVTYETPDGRFSVYISALSFDHAQLMLDDLKASGKVSGEVQAVYKGGE